MRQNTKIKVNQATSCNFISYISYACGSALYTSTSMADDDDLVSNLVSLYISSDYPFFPHYLIHISCAYGER